MSIFDYGTTGRPDDAMADILFTAETIIGKSDVTEFYIGRTVDPENAKSRHGADELHLVYKTSSLDFAKKVEDALIDELYGHIKCSNEEDSAAGGTPETFDWCYVYVAVWRKA